MKILLAANTLFTFLMAGVMLFLPVFFLCEPTGDPTAKALTFGMARMVGFSALAMGILSLLMIMRKLSLNLRFVGFGALAAFHLGLGIAQVLNAFQGMSPVAYAIIHGVFFLIFVAMFIWVAGRKEDL